MSLTNTITVLLQLDAISKADKVFQEVAGALDDMSAALKGAEESSVLTGQALADAQVKAEATGNAYTVAMEKQRTAMAGLTEATQLLNEAEVQAAIVQKDLAEAATMVEEANVQGKAAAEEYYGRVEALAAQTAAAVDKAAAEQVAALDKVNKAQVEAATRAKETAAATAAASTENDAAATSYDGVAKAGKFSAAAIAGIGYESLKAAANFQSATTVLVTSGGETEKNIGMVRDGLLQIAATTGTTTDQLIKGMYQIGSAGYTGAQGLKVLQTAAEGAKAENADLGTVTNALTTVMRDYYGTNLSVDQAQKDSVVTMNQLIYATSHGKTTTEAMAGALAQVLPIAAATHLGFDQISGAMATTTGEGMSADQSAQDLRHTIEKLQSPTAAMTKEMANYGIASQDVSKNLGTRGLTGTMEMLQESIMSKMGPAGTTLLNAFNQSKLAANDANIMFQKLPPSLQEIAQKVINGTISYKDFNTAIKNLSPDQMTLMKQWESLQTSANGFNNLLKSGSNASETYQQALKNMTGDQTTLTASLMLSGTNLATFQSNVSGAGQAAKTAGTDVSGWSDIQNNFNQQMSVFKQQVEVLAIKIGTDLIPVVTSAVKWFTEHKTVTELLATAIGVTLMAATTAWIATMIGSGFSMMAKAVTWMTGLKAGAEGAAVAEGEAALATKGLTLSMETMLGPIGLAVAAIGSLSGNSVEVAGDVNKTTVSVSDLSKTLTNAALGSKDAQDKLAGLGYAFAGISANAGKPTADMVNLDKALAQMVSAGNAKGAALDLQYLEGMMDKAHMKVTDLTGNLPNYDNALKAAQDQQKATGDSAATAAGQIGGLDNATQRMDNQIAGAQALTQMRTDFQNLSTTIQENGRDINDNTAKGLANEQQFNMLAQEISQYRDQQLQAGADTNKANQDFNNQYNQLIQTAQGFGYGKNAVIAYLQKIGLIPQSVKTSLNVDTAQVERALHLLTQLQNQEQSVGMTSNTGSHAAYAHGGLVGGTGSGTSDSNLAWVSRGEYVVGADSVSRLGSAFFDAVNAGEMDKAVNLLPSASGGVASRIGGGGSGGGGSSVYMNITIPGMVAAGPQSAQWFMQQMNQYFVQQILPQAGVQIARASS